MSIVVPNTSVGNATYHIQARPQVLGFNIDDDPWIQCCWIKVDNWRSGSSRAVMGFANTGGPRWMGIGWDSADALRMLSWNGGPIIQSSDTSTNWLNKWTFWVLSRTPAGDNAWCILDRNLDVLYSGEGSGASANSQLANRGGWGSLGLPNNQLPGQYAHMRIWRYTSVDANAIVEFARIEAQAYIGQQRRRNLSTDFSGRTKALVDRSPLGRGDGALAPSVSYTALGAPPPFDRERVILPAAWPPAPAVTGGLSIPIAMHNYRRRRVS